MSSDKERSAPKVVHNRIGFLQGRVDVPEDFEEMFEEEIRKMFSGEAEEDGLMEPST